MIPSLRLALCISVLPLSSLSLVSQIPTTPKLKRYDVRDLIADPIAKVQPAKAKAASRTDKLPNPPTRPTKLKWNVGKADSAQMAQFFARFARPKLGDDEEIFGSKGALVVRGTPARHRWLSSALEANREHARSAHGIGIESELLSLSAKVFRTHLQPLLRNRGHVVLSDAQRTDLVRKLTAIDGVSLQRVPRLVTGTMTTAGISIGEQTSYIKDFDVQVETTKVVTTPVVDVIRHGVFLQSTVGMLQKGTVGVDLSLVDVRLQQPIPVHKVDIGVGAPLTIQLPETRLTRRRVMLELSQGQAALVTLSRGKMHLVTILRAKIAEPKKK